MTGNPDSSEHPTGAPEEEGSSEQASPDAAQDRRLALPSLGSFAAIQRQLASLDFVAIQAARRMSEQAAPFKQVVEAQDAIAREFARSIDFSRLAETIRGFTEGGTVSVALDAQQRWAESLAKSIDFTALNRALISGTALSSFVRTGEAFHESLREQAELLARLRETVTFNLPQLDLRGLADALDRWIPSNLRGVSALGVVAAIALDEGLPLSWVPRSEIVVLIVEAGGSDARLDILKERCSDILDDCEEAVGEIDHEWAVECRNAIAAIRAGLDGPAQSHASNIIDSIVLRLHGDNGRAHTKGEAQKELDDLPLRLAAENLTLRPLFRAFTTWYPNTSVDPPNHFARHATSHAVGHAGVFAPISALVAVMLATSLTVQYANRDPEAGP